MTDENISPDGKWLWNGTEWVTNPNAPKVSADGRWLWNGSDWVPNPHGPQPVG